MVRIWSSLAVWGLASVLSAAPAAAQRAQGDAPALQDLIQQLQPSTRGIRVPAQQPPSGAPVSGAPIGAAPASPAPASAAAATPAPPPSRLAATTAPEGTAAASLSVRFATGSATLTPDAERTLDVLGRALSSAQLAPFRFRIEGHTDTMGGQEQNQSLSERRATAVRDYLAARHGVNPSRLDTVGLGESQLLIPTPDETSEARNRRVQVVNLGG